MSSGSERAWFLPDPAGGCLEVRLESGDTRLLPPGTQTRSLLLSNMLKKDAVMHTEVLVPVGVIDAWLTLLSWDEASKRSLPNAQLVMCTHVRFCPYL